MLLWNSIVTTIRAKASSVVLIASLVALMGGPLLAASPHEVCDAMRHACEKVDSLASCCCGDRSDNNTTRIPAGRSEVGHAPPMTVVTLPSVLPTNSQALMYDEPVAFARPPDLRILFSDLRI
jgi:hypothetical protein